MARLSCQITATNLVSDIRPDTQLWIKVENFFIVDMYTDWELKAAVSNVQNFIHSNKAAAAVQSVILDNL